LEAPGGRPHALVWPCVYVFLFFCVCVCGGGGGAGGEGVDGGDINVGYGWMVLPLLERANLGGQCGKRCAN
jgi:hypothetical protein